MKGCARRSVVGAFILGAWLLAGVVPAASAQSADTPVDQVIALEKSGLSDDLIIRAIARDKLHGDLGTSDMLKLKNAGVSDRVITAMTEGPAAAPLPGPRRHPLRPAPARSRRAG